MISLTNVCRSGIRLAVRGVVAQRFHASFGTLIYEHRIVVTTHGLDAEPLKLVYTSVGAVAALQLALKWIIRDVRWRFNAHDVAFGSYSSPGVGASAHTECLVRSSMITRVRAKLSSEFVFKVFPALREVRHLITMRWVCDVIVLPDVTCFGIISAIRRMITKWSHVLFIAFIYHDNIKIARCGFDPNLLKNIFASILTVFGVHNARKRRFWFVRRRFGAHDVAALRRCLPLVAAAVRAESFLLAAVRTRVRAESRGKFRFEVLPSTWEV